jgi:hypothetical protein
MYRQAEVHVDGHADGYSKRQIFMQAERYWYLVIGACMQTDMQGDTGR